MTRLQRVESATELQSGTNVVIIDDDEIFSIMMYLRGIQSCTDSSDPANQIIIPQTQPTNY